MAALVVISRREGSASTESFASPHPPILILDGAAYQLERRPAKVAVSTPKQHLSTQQTTPDLTGLLLLRFNRTLRLSTTSHPGISSPPRSCGLIFRFHRASRHTTTALTSRDPLPLFSKNSPYHQRPTSSFHQHVVESHLRRLPLFW